MVWVLEGDGAQVRAHEHAIATRHLQAHALVMGVAQPDRETASFHLGCEVENPKGFHAIRRDYSSCTTPMWRNPRVSTRACTISWCGTGRCVSVASGVGTNASSSPPNGSAAVAN